MQPGSGGALDKVANDVVGGKPDPSQPERALQHRANVGGVLDAHALAAKLSGNLGEVVLAAELPAEVCFT